MREAQNEPHGLTKFTTYSELEPNQKQPETVYDLETKVIVQPTKSYKAMGKLPTIDVKAVYLDEGEEILRRAAARQLLVASGEMEDARHSDVLAAMSEITDRIEGRPLQTQRVEGSLIDDRQIIIDMSKWQETKKAIGETALLGPEIDQDQNNHPPEETEQGSVTPDQAPDQDQTPPLNPTST